MVKCPVCGKEISGLDESNPYCHVVFYDIATEENQEKEKREKTYTEEYEKNYHTEEKRTYADCLNFMANLNIILSIIGAIAIWAMFGTTEVLHKGTYFSDGYT